MLSQEKLATIAVYAPLLGFIANIVLWKAKSYARACTLIGMSIAVVSTILLWLQTGGSFVANIAFFDWISVDNLRLFWGIKIDPLVMIMLGVVNVVSLLVHIYSVGYMAHDRSKTRFMGYLSFFTFMMLALISAPNMVQLFVGWEGVGLASYLLIGFWYEKPAAGKAATKAFVVNRVGDVGLVLAMATLFFTFGSLDFDVIRLAAVPTVPPMHILGHAINTYDLIGFFLIIGAMGKSAQFGLHVWLPDAMEGPTPVSALIHAATMVTAGIFLVARFSYLFEMAPIAKEALIWIGITTALFAGTVALAQNDIKRIIAYSTCSQLGYMTAALGAGAYRASIFHLGTHAFFKALLFLGAGSVIHAMSDEQDITKMGGLKRLIPRTYAFMWIGTLALIGMPFFAGFYSKDAILESLYHTHHYTAYGLGLMVVALTSFYSLRLMILTFHGKPKANDHVMAHVHESPNSMLGPLVILAIGAIFSGYFGERIFVKLAMFDWKGALIILPAAHEHPSMIIELLPLIFMTAGIVGAYLVYGSQSPLQITGGQRIYRFLAHKWWVDEVYERFICNPILGFGKFLWQVFDVKIIDAFGPNGMARLAVFVSTQNRMLQTGYVYHYALIMVIGLLALAPLLYLSLTK